MGLLDMAPTKKVTTSKAMTKGAIAEAIAASCELKKSVCAKALNVLAEVATQEVARKSGSVWQGGDGQSEASQEDREGLPSCCFEIKYLSPHLPLYLEPLSVGHPAEWLSGC